MPESEGGRLRRVGLAGLLAASLAACSGSAGSPTRATDEPLRIVEPGALALDSDGNLYVADRALHRVIRIDVDSSDRSVAVTGIRDIVGLAFDDIGRLHVGAGERIYRVDGTSTTTIAGTGERGHEGDLGPATEASLAGAIGFEIDHDEAIYIAEYDNTVRFIHPNGVIETLAGTGKEGYAGDGGPARQALVAHPHDVAVRRNGVVVADSHNRVLRFIAHAGGIRTLARGFNAPVVVEGGPGDVLYVADAGQNAVFSLAPRKRRPRLVAEATVPFGLAVDSAGNVYVSELDGERRVLRISAGGTAATVLSP